MPFGNRLAYAAVGFGIGALVALLIVAALPDSPQRQAEPPSRVRLSPLGPSPDPYPERKEWREEQDLKAQREQATWAFWAVAAASASVGLTGVGVVLLFFTLRYTRDAAVAAKQTVIEAQKATAEAEKATAAAVQANTLLSENSELELRAYLSVEPAGIILLGGQLNGLGHVDVRNVGKLPARNVAVFVHMKILNTGEPSSPDTVFPVDTDNEAVSRVIQPGAAMRQGSEHTFPLSQLRTPKDYAFVYGDVYYEDGYKKRRHTRFCHRYACASHTRSDDEIGRTGIVISKEKARYHEQGNDAD
jgi:hypothetical protein